MKMIVLSMRPLRDFFMASFFDIAQKNGADVLYIGISDEMEIVSLDRKVSVMLPSGAVADLARMVRDFVDGQSCWIWDAMGSGGIHLLLLLKFVLPKTFLVYDVFDNYLYDKVGLEKILTKVNDSFKRIISDDIVVHSEELRHIYPKNCKIDNASSLIYIEREKLTIENVVSIASFDRRYDFSLVAEIAKIMPNVNFHLYGWNKFSDKKIDKELSDLDELKNIFYHGPYNQYQLQSILNNYSIGLVPYRIDKRLTKYINPDKIYHYLCSGLEVVSTFIPQAIRMSSCVHLADTALGFARHIEKLGQAQVRKNNPAVAYANSWEQRYQFLSERFQWCR